MPRGRESRRPRVRRCVDRLEVKIRRARDGEKKQDEGRRVDSRENGPDPVESKLVEGIDST